MARELKNFRGLDHHKQKSNYDHHRDDDEIRKLSIAVEQSPSTVVITDSDGTIEYVNPKFTHLTGYSSDEVVGKNPRILKSGHTSPEEYRELWKTITSGKEWRGEFLNKKKNGEFYWEDARISPIKNSRGEIINFIALKEDITERKKAEEELQTTTWALGERIKELNCLYEVSTLLMGSDHLVPEVFQKAVNLIPTALQHPDITCARFTFNGSEVTTHNFQETPWKVSADIIAAGKKTGVIEVYYLDEKPFLQEEGHMIEVLALELGKAVERKKTEEQLRYQAFLLENVSDAVISSDMDFDIKSWNKAAEKIYGWKEEEVMGRSVVEITKLEYLHDRIEDVVNQFKKEGFWWGEVIQKAKDGRTINILSSVTLLRDDSGIPIGAVAINRDITERKKAETELRQSESKLRNLITQSYDGIVLVDEQGMIIEWNKSQEKIAGLEASKVLGRHIWDVQYELAPNELKTQVHYNFLRTAVQSILETGNTEGYERFDEQVIQRVDGNQRIVQSSFFPIKTQKGYMIGAVLRDVTDLKRKEEKLHEQKEELAIYLDIITHDLRNFNSAAAGYLQLALKDPSIPEKVRYCLNKSTNSILRTDNLLDSISILMRQNLAQDYNLFPVNVFDEIGSVTNSLYELFPDRDIKLKTVANISDCTVMADSLFKQILLNLLTNAVKNDDSEVVEIEISLDSGSDSSMRSISVVDHGKGIPPEQREKLFSRFSEFKKKGKGSGLGLHIVKTLVERYYGKLGIESRIPDDYTKGTVFKLELLSASS